jgi:hypothetical protein
MIQLDTSLNFTRTAISLGIRTDLAKSRRGEEWAANPDLALSPESIAKVRSRTVCCHRQRCLIDF